MNVINDYLNFGPLLKDLRKILTGMEERLYWQLNGHLQIVGGATGLCLPKTVLE